jgi:hypothetical protein
MFYYITYILVYMFMMIIKIIVFIISIRRALLMEMMMTDWLHTVPRACILKHR